MKKLITLTLLMVFMLCANAYAISVSAVSGSLTESSTITVDGLAFGTKASAAPRFWDTFEGGTSGVSLSGNAPVTGANWSHTHHTPVDPMYDDTYTYNGSMAGKFDFTNQSQCDANASLNGNSDTFYVYFKRYFVPPSSYTAGTTKLFYARQSVNDFGSGSMIISAIGASRGAWILSNNSGDVSPPSTVIYSSLSYSQTNNSWGTWECFSANNNHPTLDDGEVEFWYNGTRQAYSDNYKTTSTDQQFTAISLGNMDQNNVDASLEWLDDVYVDVTRQRVLIFQSTTIEIQICSSWSDTEVQFTFRQGQLQNGEATLRIFDEDGNYDDYLITIGQETVDEISDTTLDDGQLSVALTGSGFEAAQGTGSVTIGGQAQTVTSWSDTYVEFTAVLGTLDEGKYYNLNITNDSAESWVSENIHFNKTVTPSITNVSDTNLDNAQIDIVITGTDFGAIEGSVSIGGVAQTVTAWTDTSITFTAVKGALNTGQSYDLTVTDVSSNTSAGSSVQFGTLPASNQIMTMGSGSFTMGSGSATI